MRLVQVRCPQCGANVSVAPSADVASCEYCGTRSRVSQRTRFLERPVAPKPHTDGLPIAVQRHTGTWIAIVSLLFVGLAALGAIVPLMMRGGMVGSDFWGGNHPMLADVNGDGSLDIIGPIRQIPGDDSTRLVAFDGKTGAELWRGPRLGTFSEVQEGQIGLREGVILYARGAGTVSSFDAKTGKPLWSGPSLGEKPRRMCAGPEGTIVIETADEQRVAIQLADGSKVQLPAQDGKPACEPIWSLAPNAQPGVEVSRWPNGTPYPDSLGDAMRVEWTLKAKTGPVIALGAKRKGTAIPHMGAYAPIAEVDPNSALRQPTAEPLWLTEVPADNPLDATSGAPDHASIDDGAIVLGYTTKGDGLRIASFAVDSGDRQWEVAIPKPERGGHVLAGVAAADGSVWVSTWSGLYVLDAKTGRLRFHIGR